MAYKILNDDLTFANVNSENPKVCFLHGWGTSGKDFNKIETHFDFITIDIPGFGKSVPFTKSFSPKSYADYLFKLIPESVDVIVGHSFGGRIAVHLSQMQNYRKIVIIASPLIRKIKPNNGFSVFKLYKAPLFKALSIFFDDSMMVDLPAGAPVLTVGVSTSPFPSKLGNSPDANAASTPDFGCSGSKCSVFSI